MSAVLLERAYVRSLVAEAVSELGKRAVDFLVLAENGEFPLSLPFLDELSLLAFGSDKHPLSHNDAGHYQALNSARIANACLPNCPALTSEQLGELRSLHSMRVSALLETFKAAGLTVNNSRRAQGMAEDVAKNYVLARAGSSPEATMVIPQFVFGSPAPFQSYMVAAVQECLQSASAANGLSDSLPDKMANIVADILYAAQLADKQQLIAASRISLSRNGSDSGIRSGLDVILQSVLENPVPALKASSLGELVAGTLLDLSSALYSIMRPVSSKGRLPEQVYMQAAGSLLGAVGDAGSRRKGVRGKELVGLALAVATAVEPSNELSSAAYRLADRLRLNLEASRPLGQFRQ